MVSVNKQSPRRQITNRKTINIPCTSLASTMTDMVKDEELMPPPSSSHKQEFTIHCENINPINENRKFFLMLFFNFLYIKVHP